VLPGQRQERGDGELVVVHVGVGGNVPLGDVPEQAVLVLRDGGRPGDGVVSAGGVVGVRGADAVHRLDGRHVGGRQPRVVGVGFVHHRPWGGGVAQPEGVPGLVDGDRVDVVLAGRVADGERVAGGE